MASPSCEDEWFVFSTEFFEFSDSNPLSPHGAHRTDGGEDTARGKAEKTGPAPHVSHQDGQGNRPSVSESTSGCASDSQSSKKRSANEPAFRLDAIEAPTTAEEYWAAEAQVNQARQGLFGDLRRPGVDVYGPTAPFSEKHLWGSKPLWYTHTDAPNCGKKKPFRVMGRRTHWPRTIVLYLAFTVMPALATVANRNLAHWVMILFYWISWAISMLFILLTSFTDPGIAPRRLATEHIHDTGDVIVVRVPAPNAEKVLEKLESVVAAEEPSTTSQRPAAAPTMEAMERLLSGDANGNDAGRVGDGKTALPIPRYPCVASRRQTATSETERRQEAADAAQRERFTFPRPQNDQNQPLLQAESSADFQHELSVSMSTSTLQVSDKNGSATSRPRLATFVDNDDEEQILSGSVTGGYSTTRPLSSFAMAQGTQQRRWSMAASSLISQRSAAASNNRYFVNSTGVITTEVPPMSPEELDTPHIEIPFRLCRTCHIFRGPRTHHCHKCGVCVDELDHHCPWTNSCVGRNNYHYFLLTLSFIHITMLYIVSNSVYLTFVYLNDHIHNNYADYLVETWYLPPIVYGAAFLVGFYFSGLGMTHIYMNFKGITTFELVKYVFVNSSYYNGVNPWDKGAWHNIVDRIFGLNAIKWLDSRYYYPVTVAFILEEKLLDWRLTLPESERVLVEAEESRRRQQMAQEREEQTKTLLDKSFQ